MWGVKWDTNGPRNTEKYKKTPTRLKKTKRKNSKEVDYCRARKRIFLGDSNCRVRITVIKKRIRRRRVRKVFRYDFRRFSFGGQREVDNWIILDSIDCYVQWCEWRETNLMLSFYQVITLSAKAFCCHQIDTARHSRAINLIVWFTCHKVHSN